MWVAEHLGDREDSCWFESAITLGQGGGTIRDFTEGRTQKHEIETRLGDMRLRCIAEDRRQVRHARLASLEPSDVRSSPPGCRSRPLRPSGTTRWAAGIKSRPGPGPISKTLCPGRSPSRSMVIRVPLNRWRNGLSSDHARNVGQGSDHRRLAQRQPRLNASQAATRARSIQMNLNPGPLYRSKAPAPPPVALACRSIHSRPADADRDATGPPAATEPPDPAPDRRSAWPSRIGSGRVRMSR